MIRGNCRRPDFAVDSILGLLTLPSMKRYTFLLMLWIATMTSSGAAEKSAETAEFNPTFTHVVYFWLKNPDSAEDRGKFEASVKKFMEDSQFAKTRFVGVPPKSTRDVVDDSFTYSLILSFESVEDQAKYQIEPAHDVFVAECKELWDKVVVYDSVPLK